MANILDHADNSDYYNQSEANGEQSDTILKREDFDGDDLYDAAMEPSGLNDKRESLDSISTSSVVKKESSEGLATSFCIQNNNSSNSSVANANVGGKRYCCYIGNMTWWTTDIDVQNAVASCGVNLAEFVDLKFHENRNNGQSKGFALAVFTSEAAVRNIGEKLALRKVHGQTLVVLPYNKQSLAKLEEATKRVDMNNKKDDKQGMLNIGTVRIGPAGSAPVTAATFGVTPRSLSTTTSAPPPTNLMNITFPAGGPPVNPSNVQFSSLRPSLTGTAVSVGLPSIMTQVQTNSGIPTGIPALLQQQQQLNTPPQSLSVAGIINTQQQPPQMSSTISGLHTAPPPLSQNIGFSGPPPATNMPPPNVVARAPPPNLSAPPPTGVASAGVPPGGMPPALMANTAAPPPGFPSAMPQMRSGMQPMTGMPTGSQQPGFPPGAHINPQVYPSFANSFGGSQIRGYPDNASMHSHTMQPVISEAEFEEIMNRNRTVSSSAINRAVSDATAGDYGSAIETLVTAISLIRQSRVSNDDRCKVLITALQDTLQGIESKSYNSRKHGGSSSSRVRDRSPDRGSSGVSSRKRHRGRSRSRSRDRYDYSSSRRY